MACIDIDFCVSFLKPFKKRIAVDSVSKLVYADVDVFLRFLISGQMLGPTQKYSESVLI